MSYIEKLKITPTCFDHQLIIIIREPHMKTLKILTSDFN
jgi:hypothetical protein